MAPLRTCPHKHAVSAAVIVLDPSGSVLVIKREDNGTWVLPSGFVEPDEAIEDAAMREVLEETGLRVDGLVLSGVYKMIRRQAVCVVFTATSYRGELHCSPEATAAEWWTQEQIAADAAPATVRAVSVALSGRTAVWSIEPQLLTRAA